jgi:hypothetical protein
MSKSKNSFTPGKKAFSSRMIQYNAVYNYLRENLNNNPTNPVFYYPPEQQQQNIICNCYNDQLNKFTSQQSSPNISSNIKISQTIRRTTGGKIQFGNYYLGEQQKRNYLGLFEGQPGGSGVQNKNKF